MEAYEESVRCRIVTQLLTGGGRMRRDDDLLRKLMLDMEADPAPILVHGLTQDATEEERLAYYHLRLLADEGFLEETGRNGGAWRMTNKGHDFVSAVRSEAVWGRTKQMAGLVSGVSLSILKDIAIGIVRDQLSKLGVPMG